MEIDAEVREALPARCVLGEGALWDAARKVVWFVDIKRQHLWHFDPATGSNAQAQAPGQIGWALPAEGGRLLCGLQDGLYAFTPETQAFAKLADIPGEPAGNRLNDACTDPSGRVWFGSMDDAEEAASGRFYLFDRGRITPAGPGGISITNGPAVNAEGTRIYFTDTIGQKILVADLLPDGGVGEARAFVDTGAHFPDAYPDGPVVDAEGYVWTGLYAGWHVARFSPTGELVGAVKMPSANATKMCFGGDDLRTAFVTTARKNLDDAALAAQPLAGSLLAFRAPVAGFAPARAKLA
jgi:sugar lactone lactonase YvrE